MMEERLPTLSNKIKKSLEVIKEAADRFPHHSLAIAWTGGKDSTVLLHLVKTAFSDKVPFRVIFYDSTVEFAEVYAFIRKIKKLWKLDLHWVKPTVVEQIVFKLSFGQKKKEKAYLMKINAIKRMVDFYQLQAIMAGIRWDEHQARSRETYFSPREDHMRIHPLLHFTEKDIWHYIRIHKVPYVSLYDKGYRSLGEAPFTKPATGKGERSGREKDKEEIMNRLRSLGYW